jgi:hypothetical protein
MRNRTALVPTIALGAFFCGSLAEPFAPEPGRFLDRLAKGDPISVERLPSGLHHVTRMQIPVGVEVHEVGSDWFSYKDPIGSIISLPQSAIASIGEMPRMKR